MFYELTYLYKLLVQYRFRYRWWDSQFWKHRLASLIRMGMILNHHPTLGISRNVFLFSSLHDPPVFLPGESQGQRSLVGCHLWGRTESDTTEVT